MIKRLLIEFMFVNCKKDKPTEAGNRYTDFVNNKNKPNEEMYHNTGRNKFAYQQDQT